jgi:hypothetical protein
MSMDKINWKELAEDLVLLEKLKKRFVEIGCSEDDAFTYATHLYINNQPIIIRTKTISDNNNNR